MSVVPWEAGPGVPWDLAEPITSGTTLLHRAGLCSVIAGDAGAEARFAFPLLALATAKELKPMVGRVPVSNALPPAT